MQNVVSQILIIACASFALVFVVLLVRNYIKISRDEVMSGMAKHNVVITKFVKLSRIGEATYLMHDARTHAFMCQAATVEALRAWLRSSFTR